jgi:hypothetical protein
MKTLTLLLTLAVAAAADGPGVLASRRVKKDFQLTADPSAKPWKKVPGVFAENNALGAPVPGHRTEIRSLWTKQHLYLLFICPYETLYLKPSPSTTTETNKLWEWDVAEAFIGTDFNNIKQYWEFQVSPQGEWVDLDIDRVKPRPEGGWRWNSGFEVKARIDQARKVWYGEMKIPLAQIDKRKPKPGLEMRINLYRLQGPPPDRKQIAWQPTGSRNHHVPEAFGRLKLEK